MAHVGFVGLGVMGGNMVSRLIDKGHTITGYTGRAAKPGGCSIAASTAEKGHQ